MWLESADGADALMMSEIASETRKRVVFSTTAYLGVTDAGCRLSLLQGEASVAADELEVTIQEYVHRATGTPQDCAALLDDWLPDESALCATYRFRGSAVR